MWPRLGNTLLGIWLMVAPSIIGYQGTARINDLIIGPLVASAAIVALWEATRPLRWMNLMFGLWLIAAPWILDYDKTIIILNSTLVGLLMTAQALVRGKLKHRFDGGWSFVWRTGHSTKET